MTNNWKTNLIGQDRVSALIFQNGKLLLMHRIRPDKEYWVLIGGSIEAEETQEEALIREVLEESSLVVLDQHFMFTVDNVGRTEHHYLVKDCTGLPKLGEPERSRHSDENQYLLTWVSKEEFTSIEKFYPEEARSKILDLWPNEDPDVFERARALNFPIGQYLIVGGSMEGHGLRKAHDLDVLVTPTYYQQLIDEGWRVCDCKECIDSQRVILKNDNGVDILPDFTWGDAYRADTQELIDAADIIQGIPFISLEEIMKWKLAYGASTGKKKHLNDAEIIREYLENN